MMKVRSLSSEGKYKLLSHTSFQVLPNHPHG